MALSRHNKDFLRTDSESSGTTDGGANNLFDKSDDDTDDTEDTEILSHESNSNTDNEVFFPTMKGHPPPLCILPR
jgi:hypothetical protein